MIKFYSDFEYFPLRQSKYPYELILKRLKEGFGIFKYLLREPINAMCWKTSQNYYCDKDRKEVFSFELFVKF